MKNNITTDMILFDMIYTEYVTTQSIFEDDEDSVTLPGELDENLDDFERFSIKWKEKSIENLRKLKKAGFNVKPCFKKEVRFESGTHRRIVSYVCRYHDQKLDDDIGCTILYISKTPTTFEYIREGICGFFN